MALPLWQQLSNRAGSPILAARGRERTRQAGHSGAVRPRESGLDAELSGGWTLGVDALARAGSVSGHFGIVTVVWERQFPLNPPEGWGETSPEGD